MEVATQRDGRVWRVDVNACNRLGETALHKACAMGRLDMIQRLLKRGADVNAQTKEGYMPLHLASKVEVVKLLVAAEGIDLNAEDSYGEPPLRSACIYGRAEIASALLDANASLIFKDKETAMHAALFGLFRSSTHRMTNALRLLRVLVQHGAEWDAKCDAITAGQDPTIEKAARSLHSSKEAWWGKVGPAVGFAVRMWIEEHHDNLPFVLIPEEEIERGLASVRTFALELKGSKNVICRRKICLVGPSEWGKTSLVKSIVSNSPQRELSSIRTIGIDHFTLAFEEPPQDTSLHQRNHEITFSDFAGQDAYQVMHSLFFTRRTLFLICVDVESYSVALLKAEMLTPSDDKMEEWMNEFVDRNIVRWVRIIFARQPEAEFAFVCTKEDTISSGPCVDKQEVLNHVKKMLGRVMVIIEDMKKRFNLGTCGDKNAAVSEESLISNLWDPRIIQKRSEHNSKLMFADCTKLTTVTQIRRDIEALLVKNGQKFAMPDLYTSVLNRLKEMKDEATFEDLAHSVEKEIHLRIKETFVDAATLEELLVKDLKIKVPDDEPDNVKTILKSLCDRGDILWYDDEKDEKLRTTVIIDPHLLIDFLKPVFNHKATSEKIAHDDLVGLPYWNSLKDHEMLLMMKRLLQLFDLWYPASEEMEFGSDLIVPAYWKTKPHAVWEFGGEGLRLSMVGIDKEIVALRVHWEFRFFNYLPDALFDQLVVRSYSAGYPRAVGPDWILYRDEEESACRVVLSRDPKSHQRSLHLEAVLATQASDGGQEYLWEIFHWMCAALAHVLTKHPGLLVTGSAHCAVGTERQDKSSLLSFLNKPNHSGRTLMGMPPAAIQLSCLQLFVDKLQ